MDQCTGAEILEETLGHLKFDDFDTIMKSSICIPCNMPYVNNIWLPRRRGDRPPPVPEGATNLGLIGQYVEIEQDIAFTMEYSARTAWEAIRQLLKRGPPPPPVYQGQFDPKGLLAALTVLIGRGRSGPPHGRRAFRLRDRGAHWRPIRPSAPQAHENGMRRGSAAARRG